MVAQLLYLPVPVSLLLMRLRRPAQLRKRQILPTIELPTKELPTKELLTMLLRLLPTTLLPTQRRRQSPAF